MKTTPELTLLARVVQGIEKIRIGSYGVRVVLGIQRYSAIFSDIRCMFDIEVEIRNGRCVVWVIRIQ